MYHAYFTSSQCNSFTHSIQQEMITSTQTKRDNLETFGEGFQEAVLGHEYMKAEHMKKMFPS